LHPVRSLGGELGRLDIQDFAGARDRDRPGLHCLWDLAHQVDVQEPILQARTYPPYNIARTGENDYRISVAVAGFTVGSGPTPFSRRGDGRAALGPVLREYIVSEAMAALGIPTIRALAAVTTGEPVWRETPLPGAVLTRVALSHIRVGTFQFFAARGDLDAIRCLADHVIARHYPDAVDAANRYRTLLDLVISRQAALMAKWQAVGFIHGVMNTDNMSIAGETIDYGPCAFMDAYHPETVYSSIDKIGRYAYGNQPRIAQWNLARLAETLLPLLAEDKDAAVKEAQEAIDEFATNFETAYAAGPRPVPTAVR
jgi:uncharacterized protein YdiU (UPF0061 family)